MSYIQKRGSEAFEQVTAEKVDYSKVLKSFTSGKSYTVKLVPEAYVLYYAHSVYKCFYTTPCTGDDLYDKAVKVLYDEADAMTKAGADEKAIEAKRDEAYSLKAKERYLVGFIGLDDGEPTPMIIDLTKKQAKTIIAAIKKNAGKAEKFAFTVGKEGSGQATTVSLDIIVDDEDMTAQAKKNFDKAIASGTKFDDELFEKVLSVASEDQQIEDLTKFGFDVARIGIGVEDGEGNKGDENLGF